MLLIVANNFLIKCHVDKNAIYFCRNYLHDAVA